MRKLLYPLVVLLVFLGITYSAFAKPPSNVADPEDYHRSGSVVYGHSHIAPVATGISGFVATSSVVATTLTDLHLFEWGTRIQISCITTAATFCFVMDSDETTMSVSGIVTDTGSGSGIGADGPGACFKVQPSQYVDVTVLRDTFRVAGAVGKRLGFCTTNATTKDWPCNTDSDCGSAGVCNLSTSNASARVDSTNGGPFEHIRGVFLMSRAGAAATCFVTELR